MKKQLTWLGMVLIFVAGAELSAQHAEELRLELSDGSSVVLYERADGNGTNTAYAYAPFNPRFSEVNGENEFSFLAYRENDDAPIEGGIMHFLLTWGPTYAQSREIEQLIRERGDSTDYLAGSLPVERYVGAPGFEIGPPDHPLAQLLLRGFNQHPDPPFRAGAKMAASFQFTARDAVTLSELLPDTEAWREVYIRFRFKTSPGRYRPIPPEKFTITKSFASCLDSL